MSHLKDELNRYLFDELNVRGELVQLSQTYREIIGNQDYPEGVRQLLAELLSATCLLTATIKFEGEITVQIQGEGPLSYIAVNGDNEQKMRGVAKLSEPTDALGLKNLVGKANMVITIRPFKGEAYQGIVALEHETLAECLAHYFEVSEQIPTKVWLYYDKDKAMAAGTLLQLLPETSEKNENQEGFNHLCHITETTKSEEIFSLEANELLHRLYHQEVVRVYEPQDVTYQCGCSEEKCLSVISQLPPEELAAIIAEQGWVSMTCDYCLTTYKFDEPQLAAFVAKTKH
ncbi:Hsp33 family molecular chaperone HslO [Thalassotalea fusca]